jgi:hypothetical protein
MKALKKTAASLIAAVLMLCVRLLRGRPFSRAMTRWVGGAGTRLQRDTEGLV